MKRISIALLIISFLCSIASPALAIDMCRDVAGHRLCIVRIKRSAKNYWEYRTKVEIDAKKQVKEIYNCRDYAPRTAYGDRTVTRRGKVAIPFKPNSLGELVCDLFG